MKTTNRIVSFLLAVLMVITFALPASAQEIEPLGEIFSASDDAPYEDTEPENDKPVNEEPEDTDDSFLIQVKTIQILLKTMRKRITKTMIPLSDSQLPQLRRQRGAGISF